MFLSTLHDRLGEPQFAEQDKSDGGTRLAAGWARVVGTSSRSDAADGQLAVRTQGEVLQAGGDLAQWSALQSGDRLHLGVMTAYGNMRTNSSADGNPYNAHGTVNGYAVGTYATWFANDRDRLGAYVDSWVQYGNFDNQVEGDLLPGEKYSSHSWTGSIEAGYALKPFGNDWVVEPQGQLIYIDYSAGTHREVNGTDVVDNSSGGLVTRLGTRVYRDFAKASGKTIQASFEANWWYTNRKNAVAMDGVNVPLDGIAKSTGEIKAGVQYRFAHRWQTWGSVAWAFGGSDYQRLTGMAGVKYAW
jgi:autotransporter family porin